MVLYYFGASQAVFYNVMVLNQLVGKIVASTEVPLSLQHREGTPKEWSRMYFYLGLR